MFREEFMSALASFHAGRLSKSILEVLVILEEGKLEYSEKNPAAMRKPNQQMTPSGSHWWETSALTTVNGVKTLL